MILNLFPFGALRFAPCRISILGFRISVKQRLREPLKIHFGGQANLFVSGLRQAKAALTSIKADLSSLPENKNFLLAAQKQLLELPLIIL